ncbi:MAG TPA: ABC transporter ATP-binding protein [Nitrososphaerales archaeon]|nr:ABC transporter ATP-binding protein [Nitrososphaerales archaeon]
MEKIISAATGKNLLTVEDVSKSFVDDRTGTSIDVLAKVSLDLEPGRFVSIVGPSGCGKSTLLNIIAGLIPPTTGQIRFGEEMMGAQGRSIGYAFQRDSLLPWRDVEGNVELGLELKGVPKEKRATLASNYIDMVGLSMFRRYMPHQLSGGMRKRVELVRALAYDPALLLLDEPFGALDAQTRILLQDELMKLVAKKTQTVLLVTHDLDEAIALSDRVVVMSARPGRIKSSHVVDLPRPRTSSDARSSSKFYEYVQAIWSEIRDEIKLQGER